MDRPSLSKEEGRKCLSEADGEETTKKLNV